MARSTARVGTGDAGAAGDRDAGFVDWYPYDHPQLGPVELGGWNDLYSWTNPPGHLLHAEVEKHAEFAVFQALASPCLEIKHLAATALGDGTWQVEVGLANTGWLPTQVTVRAAKNDRVRPIVAELLASDAVDSAIEFLGTPSRTTIGQLGGGVDARFALGRDGTPDRALVSWVVRAATGTELTAVVRHDRAGTARASIVLT